MNRFFFFIFVISAFGVSPTMADPVVPVDSASEIETRIAGMLRENLKIEATLEALDDAGKNVRVFTLIRESQEMGTPKLATYVDTQIIRKTDQNVAVQIIMVYSAADINLVTKDRLKLLEWTNSWNKSYVPVHAQIVDDRLLLSSNLVMTPLLPIEEERVLFTYLSVTQAWPAVLKSLKSQGLITE